MDILSKKRLDYGPLWCDEGVYQIEIVESCSIWQHLLKNWRFPFWKNFVGLLWSIIGRDWSRKYISREWDIWSFICKVSNEWWRLYQEKACNVNICRIFAASLVPKISWVARTVPQTGTSVICQPFENKEETAVRNFFIGITFWFRYSL